mgnify:CR=1
MQRTTPQKRRLKMFVYVKLGLPGAHFSVNLASAHVKSVKIYLLA